MDYPATGGRCYQKSQLWEQLEAEMCVCASVRKKLWKKDGAEATICCEGVPAKSPNCSLWRRFTEEEEEEGGARHHGSSYNNSWDFSDTLGSAKTSSKLGLMIIQKTRTPQCWLLRNLDMLHLWLFLDYKKKKKVHTKWTKPTKKHLTGVNKVLLW